MGSPGSAALIAARRRLAIRRELATTPGRLRLTGVLLALGAIAFGVITAAGADTRSHAVDDVATTESLLVRAVDVSASLSNAHAIAAFGFLEHDTSQDTSRKTYRSELRRASVGLAELAGKIGRAGGSRLAVRRITELLPVYSGLIDSARANQRQGFPVGNAYLRRASRELRLEMLPRARALYEIEAGKLIAAYRSGVSGSTWLAVILAGAGMLALLVATQVYIARTTNRILNPPLTLATAILVALMTWIVLAFAVEQHHLSRAQSIGSDPVELLTATSILASRAQANESVALSSRGGGEEEKRLTDVDRGFKKLVDPIGSTTAPSAAGSDGLLDVAVSETDHSIAELDAIYAAYKRYREAHAKVVRLEELGDFRGAVQVARDETKPAADRLDDALAGEVDVAQARFEREVERAASPLDGLAVGIPLLTILVGVLALLGVRMRLEEYR